MALRHDAAVTTIDIPARSGVRGRLDKLCQDYSMKAHALHVAIKILDEDDRQQALQAAPGKFLQAINHRNGHAIEAASTGRKVRAKKKGKRIPMAEWRARVQAYLSTRDSATTVEIVAALKSNSSAILKALASVGKIVERANGRQPGRWALKGATHQGSGPKPRARKRVTLPRAERHDQIRAFLQKHPNATTTEIVKGLKVQSNSTFLKLIREVARPAQPTKPRELIHWVLQGAAS